LLHLDLVLRLNCRGPVGPVVQLCPYQSGSRLKFRNPRRATEAPSKSDGFSLQFGTKLGDSPLAAIPNCQKQGAVLGDRTATRRLLNSFVLWLFVEILSE